MFYPNFIFRFFCLSILTLSIVSISSTSKMATNGIFWGTFDPPTLAHKEIIMQTFSTGIDHLYIIVNSHGHKRYTACLSDRLAMLNTILPNKYPLTVLVQDKNQSWSVQDIKNTFGSYPEVKWYIFSGQDNLASWAPDSTYIHDQVFIVPRGQTRTPLSNKVPALPIAHEYTRISSTAVRNSIKNGNGLWQNLLSPPTIEIILERQLYQ